MTRHKLIARQTPKQQRHACWSEHLPPARLPLSFLKKKLSSIYISRPGLQGTGLPSLISSRTTPGSLIRRTSLTCLINRAPRSPPATCLLSAIPQPAPEQPLPPAFCAMGTPMSGSGPSLQPPAQSGDLLSSIADASEDRPVRCYKFRQQELWAFKPVWSPRCVVILYYLMALLFIPIGSAVLITSLRMSHSNRFRYDDVPQCSVGTEGAAVPRVCTIKITIDKGTTGRSYMYYGLVNYFQNARNYIKSRSAEQLRGKAKPGTGDCTKAGAGIDFKKGDKVKVVPCGLTAFSRFNDSFALCRDLNCTSEVPMIKKGIAWDVDREKRFKPGDVKGGDGYTEESNELVTDEDFMVWMRLATYNNFHKLYRIIDEPLPAGDYFVRINNSYPVEQFEGQKFVFISETRWFGGRSRFLGIAYLTVGSIALVAATLFLIRSGSVGQSDIPPETTIPLEGYEDEGSVPEQEGGAPSAGGNSSAEVS